MVVTILDSQLRLIVSDAQAKPDVFINPVGHVIFHLTQGFNPSTFPTGQGDALTAGAHVALGGNPGATDFAFVQIARSNFWGAFYAGRIPHEGSVGVMASVPPALANPVMLDASGSPPDPWFQDPSRTSFVQPFIHSTWGDHPASRIPSKVQNSFVSNVHNFIFQYIDDREFWTIFAGRDPGGTLRFIAHFHWQVRYEVEFMWRNGAAVVRRSKSVFNVRERNTKGRPTEASIQALLTNPSGTRANVVFGNAIRLAFSGPRGPNRGENPRWFVTVPPDFWG
jgi:hypothetical protein